MESKDAILRTCQSKRKAVKRAREQAGLDRGVWADPQEAASSSTVPEPANPPRKKSTEPAVTDQDNIEVPAPAVTAPAVTAPTVTEAPRIDSPDEINRRIRELFLRTGIEVRL
ncbi:unnamed protein product [Polarella glacialis]|uniref:Uncharacterized protein n=1 Tax=Polarella glacialis TaxID=89957 RepID=A0A813G7D5_POLGL|nr:unnamed protein product [Polarella glacialis]